MSKKEANAAMLVALCFPPTQSQQTNFLQVEFNNYRQMYGEIPEEALNRSVAYVQWGKKVFSQPPIVQVLPLKKMSEACIFQKPVTSLRGSSVLHSLPVLMAPV